MTCGLAALAASLGHGRASATAPPVEAVAAAAADERLPVWEGMPPLAQRYRVVGVLGEGTFAQLLAAVDLYRDTPDRPARVAIKVMHRPFGPIGERVRAPRVQQLGVRAFNDDGGRGRRRRLRREASRRRPCSGR